VTVGRFDAYFSLALWSYITNYNLNYLGIFARFQYQAHNPGSQRTQMGSFNSRPERPQIRVLLPTKPSLTAEAALQQRISLNRATLRATLQKLGHPAQHRSWESRRRTAERPKPPSSMTRFSHRMMLGHRQVTARLRDRTGNKPPPRLPRLPDYSTQTKEEHRRRALRALESRPESLQFPGNCLRLGTKSRVPSIIFRRIKKSIRSVSPTRWSQGKSRVHGAR
jgi:hypothetical protein